MQNVETDGGSALTHNMAGLLDDTRLQDFTAVNTPTVIFSVMVACSLASGYKISGEDVASVFGI